MDIASPTSPPSLNPAASTMKRWRAMAATPSNPQAGVAGGIVEREAPIQVSNVAIFNPDSSKADRVGFKVEGDTKVRIFKSTGEAIDA